MTALHYAVSNGDLNVVEYLITEAGVTNLSPINDKH